LAVPTPLSRPASRPGGRMIVVKIGKMGVENRAKKGLSGIFGFVVWGGVVNKGVRSEKCVRYVRYECLYDFISEADDLPRLTFSVFSQTLPCGLG